MVVNFSQMSGPVANLLRRIVHAVPAGWVVPVLQGPLRGARWFAGANNAGCWLGTYELDVQHLFTSIIAPGDVVYDLGANAGFFSLLFARLVGPTGRVYAFEPHPDNARLLRQTLKMNDADRVTVIEAAVADREGFLRFSGGNAKGHLDPSGEREVRTVVLDDLWQRGEIEPPNIVKFDVEGAEDAVLRGMRRLLVEARPQLVIEFHGAWRNGVDVDGVSLRLLREAAYRWRKLDSGKFHAVADNVASVTARS